MKSKYTILFQQNQNNTEIQIRKNNKEYILMYCKNTVNDFDKKAIRIKDVDIESIIEHCKNIFDIELTKEDLNESLEQPYFG